MFMSPDAPRFGHEPEPPAEKPIPIVHDPTAGMEPDPGGDTPAYDHGEPAPELTRVNRVSGHEVADKLRQERRVKRLEEKGY